MATGTTFSPLSYRPFAFVWMSVMASHFANSISGVGAQWLMTSLDGRADMVGLIHSATTLPIMFLALIGGAIADLYDRRRIMLTAQISVACISLVLAWLSWNGLATPWLLIGLTFALGTGIAFFQPAVNASIQVLVPRSEVSGAIGLNVTGFNVARTVGPAVGGAIVAAGGAFAAFAVSAVFSLVAAGILFAWKAPAFERTITGLRSVFPAIVEGLRAVRDTPQLRSIAIRSFGFTFCGTSIWGLMPIIARDIVGGGPERFGILLGALGLGALIGSALSHEFRRRFSPESLTRTAGIVFATMILIIVARPGFTVTMIVLVVGGAFWVQALSGFTVSAQLWAPKALIGRITSTVSVTTWGGLGVGAWFWGRMAEIVGTPYAIGASAVALALVVAFGLIMPLADRPPEAQSPQG